MSNFSEILEELIFELGFDQKTFANAVDIPQSCITDYLKGTYLPKLGYLIKIAEFKSCSTDFLLGLEEERADLTFMPCPPFSERLRQLKGIFNCTYSRFYGENGITKSRFYEWLNGVRQPSADSLVKLAKSFDCRVDFILGREK